MILVGDIGGTKTILALYSKKQGLRGGAIFERRFESCEYNSLEAIITEFLLETQAKPIAASFGVAGPVRNGQAKITNLPWTINSKAISDLFTIKNVYLLNDLESIAIAVPHLSADDIYTLNQGTTVSHENIAVVAPGTGLGIAYLIWTGNGYKACASEGGHTAFSPRNSQQVALGDYLQNRYGHVSFERICSGSGLPNIYQFLKQQGNYLEPDWLKTKLDQVDDHTPLIVEAAIEHKAKICEVSLDIFVQTLGTIINNMAVTLLPKAGIYLGGGIPPRILKRLQQADFLNAICDAGRFSSLNSSLPVHVILDPNAALQGAAWFGLEQIEKLTV
jgi:glucokinase